MTSADKVYVFVQAHVCMPVCIHSAIWYHKFIIIISLSAKRPQFEESKTAQ